MVKRSTSIPGSATTTVLNDGGGAMTHEDSMRSLRLFGEEAIPATREIATGLDLKAAFERDTRTGADLTAAAAGD